VTRILNLDDIADIKIDNIVRKLSYQEKTLMLKRLLGPLLDEEVLTDQESAFYFIHTTRDRTLKRLCATFKVTEPRVHQVLASAEGKIRAMRGVYFANRPESD